MSSPQKRTWAEVSLDNIRRSCRAIRAALPERSITGEGKQAMQMREAIKKVKGIFTKNGNMTGE